MKKFLRRQFTVMPLNRLLFCRRGNGGFDHYCTAVNKKSHFYLCVSGQQIKQIRHTCCCPLRNGTLDEPFRDLTCYQVVCAPHNSFRDNELNLERPRPVYRRFTVGSSKMPATGSNCLPYQQNHKSLLIRRDSPLQIHKSLNFIPV